MSHCSSEIIDYMNEYVDEEISAEHLTILREHLKGCVTCQEHLHELKKTDALLQSTTGMHVSSGFTANVMSALPKEVKSAYYKRWARNHPFAIAASLFIILMGSTMFSYYGESQQFSFSKQPNIQVSGDTVIVPEGETVKGDLVVKNGDVKIEGTVEGNVTVIHGENYLAGAGEVTGKIEEIDQIFEWLWFNIKNAAVKIVEVSENQ